MSDLYENLTIIDLISEKHSELRAAVDKQWAMTANDLLSHSETHLLVKCWHRSLSISDAASLLHISRQAAHKTVKRLEELLFVQLVHLEGNKRDKYIELSEKGEQFCASYEELKRKIDEVIIRRIGREDTNRLREMLAKLEL